MSSTNSVSSTNKDGDFESVAAAREMPSWLASIGVHIAVLIALSFVTLAVGSQAQTDHLLTAVIPEVENEIDYKFDINITDSKIGNGGDGKKLTSSQAVASVVNVDVQRSVQRRIEENVLSVDAAPVSSLPSVSESQLSSSVETSGGSERTGGVAGSLDRITYEIMNSLRERPTLVVWLFDESPSLKLRRTEITGRFENVYRQLSALNPEQNQHLKTAVMGFGKDVHFYGSEPTNDVQEAVKLVNEMKDDDAGIENVFTALGKAVEKYKKYRVGPNRHNVMVVIATDERGDDLDQMEKVSASCVASGMKVFCIAHSSPFGRQKGYVRWTFKDGKQDDVAIDQGPESIRMEVVDLPFWGATGMDLSRMSSGLGPYHLTRVCAETGGLYLITDDHRNGRYDFAVMRSYLPDYRPEKVYEQEVKKNGAKLALVMTAERIKDYKGGAAVPSVVFRADTDNALRTEAATAQRQVVVFEAYVTEVVKMLEPGEKDRAKIKEPRWRAAFDLAYGRALALQARAAGYNILLAQMKTAPKVFTKQGGNTWLLKPSKDIAAGPTIKKMVQKSTEMLSRVVDEHAGTPWADMAARELREPMGWEWVEEHRDYAGMERAAAEAAKKQVLFAEEEKQAAAKKGMPVVKAAPPRL